jgi:integrase
VTIRDAAGHRRDVYLGVFNSEASRAEYRRVLAEWEQSGRQVPGPKHDLTVAELLLAFSVHAKNYYRNADGTPSRGLDDFKLAGRSLRKLYGHTPVALFGPRSLRVIQDGMARSGLARTTINGWIRKIKHIFKWGAAQELVPPAVYHGLVTVPGLKKGRTEAREPAPIKPVAVELVEAVIPHVRPPVAAMIKLQMLTGARPGEVVLMRGCDLETGGGTTWRYRPHRHKGDWRNHDRVVFLGPQAQAVIKPFLQLDLAGYLFRPSGPRSRVGHYITKSYNRAVARGCAKANVPGWHVNQLRHLHGTAVRQRYGVEAAKVLLGHQHVATTEIYAEKDFDLAARIAAEVG